jgi:hypothetical protein
MNPDTRRGDTSVMLSRSEASLGPARDPSLRLRVTTGRLIAHSAEVSAPMEDWSISFMCIVCPVILSRHIYGADKSFLPMKMAISYSTGPGG